MGRAAGKHLQQNSRRKLLLAASILSSCFLLSQGQTETIPITAEPATPRKGGTVTLTPETIPDKYISCRWYRGESVADNLILIHYSSVPEDTRGEQYTGRETVGSGCSLQITNLNASDSGTYTLNVDGPGIFAAGSTKFEVVEPVANVTITGEPARVFEGNRTVLTCASAGTSVSYFWLKGGRALEAVGHISLTNNSQVLTFDSVSRNDSDVYTCYANNTFSSNSSSWTLDVFYGPGEPVISPDNPYYWKGTNLSLTCTAESNPAQYNWSFKDVVHPGSILSLTELTLNDTGNYTCEAYNNETGRSSFKTVAFKVLEKLGRPTLSPAKHAALESDNVTLHCNISSSTAFDISWFRDNGAVPPKAVISEDKKTLTLHDFTKDDAGTYTCVASNPLGREVSNPSEISLAYGPTGVRVEPSGVISQTIGTRLDLRCVADSNPEAQFQWFFNGTDRHVASSNFSVASVAWNDEGNYTCQASNAVTNARALASVFVKVTSQDAPDDGGLSGGAIAGIVIGCLAAIILIAGLLYFICTRTSLGRTEHHISNGNIPSAPGHNQGATDTKPRSGEEDIQYSTLAFNANNPPQPAPGGTAQPLDGTIIYSEIKKK